MKQKRKDIESPVRDVIGRSELAAELARSAGGGPAQGGSAGGAPHLALIVSNSSYNRYTVQLADNGGAGQSPEGVEGQQVVAVNAAEPFDQTGQLEADTPVLVWPSQGLYFFFAQPPAGENGGSPSFWAKIVSGSGPSYTVKEQQATGASTFADASGASNLTAYNTWELTVDTSATDDVPAGAVVRVWAEPDTGETTRYFFFYPIHAVYR